MALHHRFFFCGGVRAGIDGYDRERFFNIAAQRELSVCEISEDHETKAVTFWTKVSDFKKMKPVARKTGTRLSIVSKFGLPFFFHRNRKRKLFAAGLLTFFLLLFWLSRFIWDISFEGNRRFTDEMLLHYMETLPVACGMKKSDISCEELESGLRGAFPEISWVSAELRGTRLIVHVKENEAVLTPEFPDKTPCDLVAKRDGTVVKTVTRSGICKVKAGDPVTAGTVLVEGTVPIYDDSMTLVNARQVHADAEIYAETAYAYEKTLPRTYEVRAKTGKVRKGIFFEAFGHSFYFLMPDRDGGSWEFVMEQRQLKLFENFYLPVYGAVITANEYVPYERAYTEAEIQEAAGRLEQEYMENLSEKAIQILGNDDKIETDGSGIRISGVMTVVEDIAEASPIENSEENQTFHERN